MKLRLMMVLSFSLLFSGGVQAAFKYIVDKAIAGNVVIADALASYTAVYIAEFGSIPSNRDAVGHFISILASGDNNDFKGIIPAISVAAKAGHPYALALVSYFTARAQDSDVNAKAIVTAFANNSVIAVANANPFGDLFAMRCVATIDIAAAFVSEAINGNALAKAYFVEEISKFSVGDCGCEDDVWNTFFVIFADAADAGDAKALSVISYVTALADAGDANAAAVVAAFAAHKSTQAVGNCC